MYLYARFCPVASATQVVGDYWTPLIVRELLYGTGHFNQLARNLPAISRTLLAGRLRALESAGVVECRRAGPRRTAYVLTPAGRALEPVIAAMSEWGLRWGTAASEPGDPDPRISICMLKDRIRTEELPPRRVVVEVLAAGETTACAWLVCEPGAVTMCFEHPGFDVDLWLRSDPATLYRIWLQELGMSEALAARRVEASGDPALVASLARWFDGRRAEAGKRPAAGVAPA